MKFFLKLIYFSRNITIGLSNKVVNKINIYIENVSIKNYKIKGKIKIYNQGNISIGENFKANSGKNYNPIGGDTILRLICHENAKLILGSNVGISNTTIVCSTGIIIEDNVLIGGGCKIWDTDFHSLDYKIRGTKGDRFNNKRESIKIKKNAFIGGGSTILKGVTIGEKSIIATGSIVVKSVPDGEVWGGNPAKFIKKQIL
ncbi:acyltransferase [uncultured Winogradskyella sp.]|uniref:acyltransferase n=1 Tax=uncultured Winogradskyella sp. TaxID=395353 RepID=UPI0030DD21D1|tara:strand:- start:19790 stop:20392 length:603 start_codon:yes stop_codon:yes gene_type:complete